jgi:threonine dehydrogenase-like Zn-dependent dehydrogenase
MKAIAVFPRKPNTVHLTEIAKPKVTDVPNGRGVLVKVLKVGVDATDREINEGKYGDAPPGYDFLILGHECFGRVEEVGPAVTHVKPGDYVTATVRRPGTSIYDLIGTNDMTADDIYYERGITRLHGYLTEYFVDDAEYIVKIPAGLKHLHVLAEPMSCAIKAITQAYEAQRRLKVWRPKLAFVLGSGQIGLLSTLALRLRGLEVYTIARGAPPSIKSEIVESFGAHYVSAKQTPLKQLAEKVGQPDLIIEGTGNSRSAFEAMEILKKNGALVWVSVTGGDAQVSVPADKINLEWVLGNKLLLGSVNGNREHFEIGVRDFGMAEVLYPGAVGKILTHPINGLDNFQKMMQTLVEDSSALKVYVNVAE